MPPPQNPYNPSPNPFGQLGPGQGYLSRPGAAGGSNIPLPGGGASWNGAPGTINPFSTAGGPPMPYGPPPRGMGPNSAVMPNSRGVVLHVSNELESISARKTTGLGQGYFVIWVTTYRTPDGELVGRQLFRIFKFDPRTIDLSRLKAPR